MQGQGESLGPWKKKKKKKKKVGEHDVLGDGSHQQKRRLLAAVFLILCPVIFFFFSPVNHRTKQSNEVALLFIFSLFFKQESVSKTRNALHHRHPDTSQNPSFPPGALSPPFGLIFFFPSPDR